MPLWMAILGAVAILGTIATSQQIMDHFIASKSGHHLKVQYDSAINWARKLGAYLITNNAILCRETVWDSTNNNRCKWNTNHATSLSAYGLSGETFSGGKLSYELSTPDDVDFNLSENIKIKFNLVAWNTGVGELKKVIGGIPGGFCRNNITKAVTGTCNSCTSNADCTLPATCVSGVCSCCGSGEALDAISSVDKDYDVVLIEVIAGENTANQVRSHIGVRRPLSRLRLSFEQSPKCALKCDVGSVASSSASCRSALEADDTTVKVKVFNQGPGVLYDLSLLREARMKGKLQTCLGDSDCQIGGGSQKCENKVCVGREVIDLTDYVHNNSPPSCTTDADCTSYHSSATCDTGSKVCVTLGALLPGDFFVFEDTIICENNTSINTYFPEWEIREIKEKIIEINNDTTATDALVYELSQNANVYSEKFMELEYKLDLTTPETSSLSKTAEIRPHRIFHHGNTVGLLDSISTAFVVYEPPN